MRAAVHFQCQIEHFSNATPCNFLNQNITSASANSIFRSNQLSKVEQNDSVETCCSSEKHGLLFHTSVSAIYPKRLLRSGAILLSKRRLKQIRPSLTHPPSAQQFSVITGTKPSRYITYTGNLKELNAGNEMAETSAESISHHAAEGHEQWQKKGNQKVQTC